MRGRCFRRQSRRGSGQWSGPRSKRRGALRLFPKSAKNRRTLSPNPRRIKPLSPLRNALTRLRSRRFLRVGALSRQCPIVLSGWRSHQKLTGGALLHLHRSTQLSDGFIRWHTLRSAQQHVHLHHDQPLPRIDVLRQVRRLPVSKSCDSVGIRRRITRARLCLPSSEECSG